MEPTLRCNNLACRTELRDQALVTTCSHTYCIHCAQRLGLTTTGPDHTRTCPGCSSVLQNLDDAVVTNLNPSEEYKTSVLSGLSPNLINECAGRALSFWNYQMTQEIVYQEISAKALTDRLAKVKAYCEQVLDEANHRVAEMQDKLEATELEIERLRQHKEELVAQCKEKGKKYLQIQELYDKLKRRAMLGQVRDAAADAVDSTLQAAGLAAENGSPPGASHGHQGFERRTEPGIHQQHRVPGDSVEHRGPLRDLGDWNGVFRGRSATPLNPQPRGHDVANAPGSSRITQTLHGSQPRPFPANTSFPGVGLSAGVKASQGGGGLGSTFASTTDRPRVAQPNSSGRTPAPTPRRHEGFVRGGGRPLGTM